MSPRSQIVIRSLWRLELLFLIMWCGQAGEEKKVVKIKMMQTMVMFLVNTRPVMTVMYTVNADEDIGVLKLWIVFFLVKSISQPRVISGGRLCRGGEREDRPCQVFKKAAKASKIKATRFSKKHQKSKFSRHLHHLYDSGTPVFLACF